MRFILSIFLFFSCTLTVLAHTHIRNVVLNGKALDREQCIYPYNSNFNFPAEEFSGAELYCRTKTMSASVDACTIAAGDTITLDFKEEEGTNGRAIENEHNGPITAYMAPAESMGEGAVWFKIFEQGYDMDSDKWAINILNENDGLIDIKIPADIKAGDYILRGEILALHLADQGVYEVYSNCVLLTVTGGGSAVPEGVDLKEVYTNTDKYPGLLWDLYDGEKKEYPIPGPPVYEAGTSGPLSNNSNTSEDSDKQSSEGRTYNNEPKSMASQGNPNRDINSYKQNSASSNEPCINGRRRRLRRKRR